MDLELSAPTHWNLGDIQSLSMVPLPETQTQDSTKGQFKSEVRLLSFEHQITASTLFGVPGYEKYSDDGPVEILSNSWNDAIRTSWLFKTVSLRKQIRIFEEGKRLDFGKELGVMLSRDCLSNFESYNISRTYSSRTTVEVECDGKRQKLVYDIPVVTFF